MLFILILIGALGGFMAGLIGIGGGVIFGPALFFVFQAAGIQDPVLTPLTVGSSLLCTFAASVSGAVAQHRARAIDVPTALVAGGLAAVAVVTVGRLVTTQPWYDNQAFQALLGIVLVVVVVRMLTTRRSSDNNTLSTDGAQRGPLRLATIGVSAGSLATLAGVGGGVVLVPLFNALLKLPLKVAAGTSTASIVLITGAGVITYALLGLGAPVPDGALGYVGWKASLALALPAIVTARMGVSAAHRLDVRIVRYVFAALAAFVAVRLLLNAFG
ncbi:MAG: sulfite exporter TauE/SafE family protein [Bacteroidota bacterium]